jgi:hypothetical protein
MGVTATGVRRNAPTRPPRSQRQDADVQNGKSGLLRHPRYKGIREDLSG